MACFMPCLIQHAGRFFGISRKRKRPWARSPVRYPYSLAAISKHIHVLEGSGLVTRRKQGSFQFVKINPLPMQHAQRWLSHYEKFWSERLDEFQHYFKDKKQKKETRR